MKAPRETPSARDFVRELEIRASCARAFDSIATVDGLRRWWTPLVTGSDQPAGTLRLEFEGMDEHIELRVLAMLRPTEIEWSIVEHSSLDEWAGTKLRFELSARGPDACSLAFWHLGLSPKLACYDDCEAGWDHFLGSIVALAEHGKGDPFRGRKAAMKRQGRLPDFEAVVAAFDADRRVQKPAPARGAFGSNGLRVDGHVFAMLVGRALVLKLPRERVDALIKSGRGKPYDAGRGRTMKEWVTIPGSQAAWIELAREARRFVGEGHK